MLRLLKQTPGLEGQLKAELLEEDEPVGAFPSFKPRFVTTSRLTDEIVRRHSALQSMHGDGKQ